MSINREDVLAVLGKITEPDLKNDLVSLNLIEQLEIDGTTITLSALKFLILPYMPENACKKLSSLI